MKKLCIILILIGLNQIGFSQQIQKEIQKADSLHLKKQFSEAAGIYLKTAEQGDAYSQNRIGYYYLQGTGVEKDTTKAISYFQKSANQGFSKGQYNLAERYYYGQGVPKDEKKAFDLFLKSAQQGFAFAQDFLGYMYNAGQGTEKSKEEAISWWTKASEQGIVESQHWLGKTLYEQGMDIEKAKYWLKLASNKGYKESTNLLNFIDTLPKYDDISYFHENLARVKINHKYGFININEDVVIPLKYDEASIFKDGFALVKISGKYSFIDKLGKEVLSLPKYDDVETFSEGLAAVKLNGKYGFIDKTGKTIIIPKYDKVGEFINGIAYVKLDKKWGFIDKMGKVIIPIIFDDVRDNLRGKTKGWVVVYKGEKPCVFNESGKEIVPCNKYLSIGYPSEGLVDFETESGYGFMNMNGTIIIAPIYFSINGDTFAFNDGLVTVEVTKDKHAIIDKVGNVLYQDNNDYRLRHRSYFSKDGLCKVHSNNNQISVGYIDKTGKLIIPLKYDWDSNSFSNGLALVKLNGRLMTIGKTGNVVTNFNQYDEIYGFDNEIAVARIGNKYGFIDITGREITPIKYDYNGIHISMDEKSGHRVVQLGNKQGLIDRTGKEIIGWKK